MKNKDIRQALIDSNLKQWKLAEELKISEFTLCRKLRHELSAEQKEKIFTIIELLKNKRK